MDGDHAAVDCLTVTERTEKRPVSIRSRGVERDCRSIVNQLVSSMPKEVLLRTSFTEYGTLNQTQATEEVRIKSKSSFARRVHFTDAKEEYEPSPDCSSGDETMSGESDTFEPVKDDLSEESDTFEPVQDDLSGERLTRPPRDKILSGESGLKQPMDRVLSGESRNISDSLEYEVGESVDSSVDSRPQSWDNTSETTSNSDMSEIAIHSLLVDWKQRGLDRETHQDPDRDRYTSDEDGTVVDNAADELELIAVSKRPTRLLPHGTLVRTNLEPSVQEATPLKKIRCVKLMDDAHAPEIMSGQMNVVKTYLKARYRLSDLLRAQRNDRMTSSLKRWIENGAPDKGDLEEDSYKILKQFYLKRNDLLYLNKDGIVACKQKEEDKVLYKYNSIVLPQLYQTELLFRSHDLMGHQGVDKVYNRIQKRFEWPGLKKACEKWIAPCLSCQQAKDPRKLRFPLQSIGSSGFNEVVQIDHQKICMTATGYNQVLVMIDHFTKYAEAAPCMTASAEETCDHLINVWIARHGCPITFQSDNGKAFVGDLTKELMKRSQVAQAHSTTYHPQTNGLVERQNRTLVSMLRVYCSRYMDDWDKHLPQVMGAYNSTEHSTTGISPHMMLTGHEKALPLTFFYPEYEGKRTAPQTYVRDVVRRQQDLNDLFRRNTQQAQIRQKRRFDKRTADAKAYSVGDYVWVSHWGQYKTDMSAKLNMNTLTCREDAMKVIGGESPTVSRLYRIPGVDWLLAEQEQFSSTTTLRHADLNGLPQENTFGPLNTRSLTDVRQRARELTPPARKGKFQAENKPNNKHHKMYRQFAKPPGQTPGEYSRNYPRTTTVDGDDKRYGKLEAPIGDGLFAAYDPLEMKAAKYLIVASSDYLYTPRSLF